MPGLNAYQRIGRHDNFVIVMIGISNNNRVIEKIVSGKGKRVCMTNIHVKYVGIGLHTYQATYLDQMECLLYKYTEWRHICYKNT